MSKITFLWDLVNFLPPFASIASMIWVPSWKESWVTSWSPQIIKKKKKKSQDEKIREKLSFEKLQPRSRNCWNYNVQIPTNLRVNSVLTATILTFRKMTAATHKLFLRWIGQANLQSKGAGSSRTEKFPNTSWTLLPSSPSRSLARRVSVFRSTCATVRTNWAKEDAYLLADQLLVVPNNLWYQRRMAKSQ